MKDSIQICLDSNVGNFPSKRDADGCYDIYANFEEEFMVIQPNQVRLIPTKIFSKFDSKYRISIRERGSNTKSGMIVMAGQIDSNYRGEWFVAIYNGNDKPIELTKHVSEVIVNEDFIRVPYSKAIAQFAVEIVPNIEIEKVAKFIITDSITERGNGMLGSSNK